MPASELVEWAAYENVCGPLGEQRFDILFAQLMAVIANKGREKGQRAIDPNEFLPKWDPKGKAQQNVAEMRRNLYRAGASAQPRT